MPTPCTGKGAATTIRVRACDAPATAPRQAARGRGAAACPPSARRASRPACLPPDPPAAPSRQALARGSARPRQVAAWSVCWSVLRRCGRLQRPHSKRCVKSNGVVKKRGARAWLHTPGATRRRRRALRRPRSTPWAGTRTRAWPCRSSSPRAPHFIWACASTTAPRALREVYCCRPGVGGEGGIFGSI